MTIQLHVRLINPFTLVFAGHQVWWIRSVFWKRELAKPMSEGAFRKTLERIWEKDRQR
jgi:hypothetical protein